MDEKTRLLKEAQNLLYNKGLLPNGRKSRSDKGQSRKPYTLLKDTYLPKNKMWAFQSVLNRLLKRAKLTDDDFLVMFDKNGYYVDIDRTKTQKAISLEEYRFNAYKEKATSISKHHPICLSNDIKAWLYNREANPVAISQAGITYEQFFCLLYHILPEELEAWTYEQWRIHYNRVPEELDFGFKFNIDKLPGTEEFHPEWILYNSIKQKEAEQRTKDDLNKRSWAAKLSKTRQ